MNKVIDYNYYLNLSNPYYFWITFDEVMIIYFFFNFGPLPNFEKDEARHFFQIWYTNWPWQVLTDI